MQSRSKTWIRIATHLAMLTFLINGLGCAFGEVYWDDPMKREYALSEVQKRYTQLVRFGDLNQAAQYVDPEQSLSFIKSFPDQGDLIFTDHKSGPIEFTGDPEELRTAQVVVTYAAYHAFSLVVFDVTEVQEWYRDGVGNNWLVRPHFKGLEQFASTK